jgi:fibronectin type 3 domain-containing protein
MDNSPLRDLTLVHVYRTEDTPSGEPKAALRTRGRIAGYDEIATIRLATPAPASIDGSRMSYPDRGGLAYGRRYTYVILAEDGQGRLSPPSLRLPVAYIAPPTPPLDLAATAGENEVQLSWKSPAHLVDGTPTRGDITYEVFRGSGPEAPLEAATPTPLTQTRFVDRGLVNDQTYSYAVRALRADAGGRARSETTPRVTATPLDTTPPSPPERLVAVVAGSNVQLAWVPSTDADVARYVVYRADARGTFARVGSTSPPITTFVDRGITAGTYRYVVTAQDASTSANESARSNEASATVP